ncbi:MAG: hypothetical protein E7458_01985 [Ruminococcaceae bacterium]|nr:hypothetical protein [Oscillospiraceae bacterium]
MKAEGMILAVTAAETAECRGLGIPLGRMSYRVSPEGVLLRAAALSGEVRGGVMIVMGRIPEGDAARLSAAILAECAAREYAGVYLDGEAAGGTAALAAALEAPLQAAGRRLYTPPGAGAGIPVLESAVTGGSYRLYLEEARARHPEGIALALLPMAVSFVLPAWDEGQPLSREELAAELASGGLQYYSKELCARYQTSRGTDGLTRFLLYDDADTLREKCRVAEAAGVEAIFLPYALLRTELPDILEI